jgi:hypothetical protein
VAAERTLGGHLHISPALRLCPYAPRFIALILSQ